ncbi:MAG: alkaline phosphatase, partial [Bacteroidales bacterium]|nr:alkaline phosphatase [Bacteroidales bacterium]
MKKIIFVLTVFLVFHLSLSAQKTKEFYSEKKAKYVFYFIGDGMGLAHVSLAEMYLSAQNDEVGMKSLNMTSMPVAGLAKTYCKNSYITCSAAAGTALATGEKTNFGRLGVFPDSILRESIAIECAQKEYRIGVISTVSIDHATPASFYAQSHSRSDYYEIGKQMLQTEINLFAGGGFKRPKGKDKDQEDLHEIAKKEGFNIIRDTAGLKQLKQNEQLIFLNPVLQAEAEMPLAIDRKKLGGYSLANLIEVAIRTLYNEKGFFVMAEGGMIDWVAHTNDAASIVHEVLDFDEAIGVALDFYKKHPDETLI